MRVTMTRPVFVPIRDARNDDIAWVNPTFVMEISEAEVGPGNPKLEQGVRLTVISMANGKLLTAEPAVQLIARIEGQYKQEPTATPIPKPTTAKKVKRHGKK